MLQIKHQKYHTCCKIGTFEYIDMLTPNIPNTGLFPCIFQYKHLNLGRAMMDFWRVSTLECRISSLSLIEKVEFHSSTITLLTRSWPTPTTLHWLEEYESVAFRIFVAFCVP